MEKESARTKILKQSIIAAFLFIFAVIGVSWYYIENHFLWETQIDGIDCSFLSIDDALDQLNIAKGSEVVKFTFINGESYEITLKELGVEIDKTALTDSFNSQHANFQETRSYSTDGFICVDSQLLKLFLESIPELQKKNMILPQNAYITWNEVEFSICEEVLGNVIDFEEATTFATEKIKNGEMQIDFSSITQTMPEVQTQHLIDELEKLNLMLNSTIHFELANGTLVTLDSNIIKNWVFQDENGKYCFNTEDGIPEFVEELAVKVEEVNKKLYFIPTGCEEMISLDLKSSMRSYLDKEKEIAEIGALLGNPEAIQVKPIYDKPLISDALSFIEIDLTRQRVFFYKDGELIVDTPCVTGKVSDGYATPPGVFYLLNKNREVYLEGYNKDGSRYKSFVEYWMRFNQGIGMHDASWRSKFGGEIYYYSGSHGCVNMPFEAAKTTYENIDNTMPIIVYNSQG